MTRRWQSKLDTRWGHPRRRPFFFFFFFFFFFLVNFFICCFISPCLLRRRLLLLQGTAQRGVETKLHWPSALVVCSFLVAEPLLPSVVVKINKLLINRIHCNQSLQLIQHLSSALFYFSIYFGPKFYWFQQHEVTSRLVAEPVRPPCCHLVS